MSYLSFSFLIFVVLTMVAYYLPALILKNERTCKTIQQLVLLIASIFFYSMNTDVRGGLVFLATILVSYGLGMAMERLNRSSVRTPIKKGLFGLSVLVCATPLLLIKTVPWFPAFRDSIGPSLIRPLGVAFYTLQIISYLSDCYTGKAKAEKNLFRYSLFISFFPQIVQGPIPRYNELSKELDQRHSFQIDNITRGIQLIIWGCFLKLVIANKAALPVDRIFGSPEQYTGAYVLIAGILYSLQLYADFYSCTTICQGVAGLFGIRLVDNFHRPYFALSVQDFWRRWHISLSTWFRDYIYIPLGGSRKGRIRTYVNIVVVFLISGLWHGESYAFLAWGLMHGLYQIAGKLTFPLRDRVYSLLRVDKESEGYRILKRIGTFFWVMIAWIFFRAGSFTAALQLFRNSVVDFNPWLVLGADRFSYGLDVHEWFILSLAILVLFTVSFCQEKGIALREVFARQNLIVRWSVYLIAICSIWIFGTYGIGFNAADFIYGGF